MKSHQLTIEGMSCNHCVMHVRKELGKIAGLVVEDVQIGTANVQYDEHAVRQEKILQAIEEAGYKLVANT